MIQQFQKWFEIKLEIDSYNMYL